MMISLIAIVIAFLQGHCLCHQDHQDVTIATTMVTDTDWLGNAVTSTSTFPLEPERKAFQTCIFGCSSVTVPCSRETPGGSTVIVVLPLTIPCSLVKCPPCTTCVSSTVSITVCPVISTITPLPATATIFTTAASIATARCQQMIEAAVHSVELAKRETSVITVTRTRAAVGCPALLGEGDNNLPITSTINNHSVCSTFIVCQPGKPHFTCPLPSLPTLAVEGTHLIDTLQAILVTSTSTSTTQEPTTPSIIAPPTITTEQQPVVTGMIAERLFQKNQGVVNHASVWLIGVPAILVVLTIM